MNRSEHERLTDELIGEATLSLLQEHGPISIKALLERLSAMLAAEGDGERRSVLAQIILEISSDSNGAPSRNAESEQQAWDKDGLNSSNVYPLFGTSQQSRSSKKH
ncbi:hypothetical protein M8013_15755 [Enterobacteriaceae bacterium H4N4]|uniref:Uncharacterized protein n=1 Tax=Silvania confinis TaxID=2926470 RepID=A0A9J6QHD3_9ENTR|nr:hypothetical protein [Silvania confinis]MCU6670196.1 hypothetical protein [Silvania confinis]